MRRTADFSAATMGARSCGRHCPLGVPWALLSGGARPEAGKQPAAEMPVAWSRAVATGEEESGPE